MTSYELRLIELCLFLRSIYLVTGESTPSYFLLGRPMAQQLFNFFPQVRLIVAARDPIRRTFSHYNMARDPVGTPGQLQRQGYTELGSKTFHEVIEEELAFLETSRLSIDSTPDEIQAVLDLLPWEGVSGLHHGPIPGFCAGCTRSR